MNRELEFFFFFFNKSVTSRVVKLRRFRKEGDFFSTKMIKRSTEKFYKSSINRITQTCFERERERESFDFYIYIFLYKYSLKS